MPKNRILVADDNKLNQDLLSAILGNDYDYLYANNGIEVISALEKNEAIDIILLDINMPQMDGFEVLQALNEKQYIKEIPVVVISTENDVAFVRRAYELGATDYISRPFNAIVIQHRVKNTLMIYSNQKKLVKLVENQIYEREKTNNAMINIFSNIIELRNHESGSHTLHVQTITNLLLHELVKITDKYLLSEADISLISSLSALHDIGKIKIPESILNKPCQLTDEEWKIMKMHTIEGYEILQHANIDQNNNFMKTAKAICRWHHEKYDGNGYPDGLKEENIPICAQVVSMADVYDALTSERCYKRSYTHDEAIKMIINGECGAFNPLLIQCLKNISDRLKESLNIGLEKYDYHDESLQIVDEVLTTNNLQFSYNTHYLLFFEQEKRKFFEENSTSGISFEFDMLLHKVQVINNYAPSDYRKQIIYTLKNELKLLSNEDWEKLVKRVRSTTREKNTFTEEVLLKINDSYRWHKLIVETLWPENGSYAQVIGKFIDIHNDVLNVGLEKINNSNDVRSLILNLKTTFPFVRIVDAKKCYVLSISKNGRIIDTKKHCYEIWEKNSPCEYCSSKNALKKKQWVSKLEVKEGKIFAVLSRYLSLNNKDYVLEIAFPVDEEETKPENRTRLMSSLLFINFYRDSLTKAYTRTYLEDFKDNLEKADAIALLDVDDFKNINDTYGHQVGDIALKEISSVIMNTIGSNNVLIRYGGDEFLAIFQEIEEEDFYNKFIKIKNAVNAISLKDYPDIKLNISIGGAYKSCSLDNAITKADREMYKEKTKI